MLPAQRTFASVGLYVVYGSSSGRCRFCSLFKVSCKVSVSVSILFFSPFPLLLMPRRNQRQSVRGKQASRSPDPPPYRLCTGGTFVDPVHQDTHYAVCTHAIDDLDLSQCCVHASSDPELFIRSSLLAYHSQLVHPLGLHLDEHSKYLLGKMSRLGDRFAQLTALVHANALIRDDITATRSRNSAGTQEDTNLEDRVAALEESLDSLLASTPGVPATIGIPAAQRVAHSVRGSSVGSRFSSSVAGSCASSAASTPRRSRKAASGTNIGSEYEPPRWCLICGSDTLNMFPGSSLCATVCRHCSSCFVPPIMPYMHIPSGMQTAQQASPFSLPCGSSGSCMGHFGSYGTQGPIIDLLPVPVPQVHIAPGMYTAPGTSHQLPAAQLPPAQLGGAFVPNDASDLTQVPPPPVSGTSFDHTHPHVTD